MKYYDEIDMREARTVSYWTGAIVGAVGMLILCLLVGLYASS